MKTVLKGSDLLPFLRSTLRPGRQDVSLRSKRIDSLNIGVCVSGGPDSMALAYLMKNVDEQELGVKLKITAFLLDHQMRPDSGREAAMVRSWLADLGIPTMIRQLDWRDMDPSQLTNVESVARERRYRHLALAAQSTQVKHLFLGHHRDDQIETALMRLIRTDHPSLLAVQGMASSSPIPYCKDVWGARNSSPPAHATDLFGSSQLGEGLARRVVRYIGLAKAKVQFMKPGGIILHRPLLSFNKEDLIATCRSNSIPYVVDETNADPTFTPRNAVRTLRSKHNLPRALQDSSILSLVNRARDEAADIRQRGTQFLRSVTIVQINLCSGIIDLSIPKKLIQLYEEDALAAANVVERLSSLVYPGIDVSTLAASAAVERLVAAMRSISESPIRFTYSNVLFEAAIPFSYRSTVDWRLSRAPLMKAEVKSSAVKFVADLSSRNDQGFYSEPLLWDRRYWIRLAASQADLIPVTGIRLFEPRDAEKFYARVSRRARFELSKLLRRFAPGDLRYTLPVLTINDEVVAFPTLSKQLYAQDVLDKQALSLGIQDVWLKWSVSYKVISEPLSEWALGSKVDATSSSTNLPFPESKRNHMLYHPLLPDADPAPS